MNDLEAAWDALHEATPPAWHVGRPSDHPERDEWVMYAFDPFERAVAGRRDREWIAKASTVGAEVTALATG